MTKLLTLSGGFHNVQECTVSMSGSCLTYSAIRRLNEHFCGIANCTCGGVFGNDVTIKDDEGLKYSLMPDGEIVAH